MTVRFGIVGAGMVAGVFHRAAADSAEFAFTGLHTRDPVRRREAAQAAGCTAFDTLDGLLASGIDALVAVTPPDARADIVAACAEARMPLLCEKPLERSAEAATALVSRMGDIPFGVVLQHRMRPSSQAAHALLQEGAMGAVRMLRVDVPWWRDPSYYAVPGRGTYARDGGGVMLTQAIHALDLGLWLAGASVTRVQGQTFRALHDLEAEDSVAAGLTFDTGAVGMFTATTAAFPGRPETIEITCDAGTLRLASGQLTVLHRDGRTETQGSESGTGSGADPMAFAHDWHLAVLRDFATALRDGQAPAVPAASALPVHRVIDAIHLSSRLGRCVDLAPDTSKGA